MSSVAEGRYIQRYETWRYLDKTRHQTLQLAVTLIGVLSVSSQYARDPILALVLVFSGLAFVVLWALLRAVNHGIYYNSLALHKYAVEIGDTMIPNPILTKWSVFGVIELALFLLGIALVSGGVTLGVESAS